MLFTWILHATALFLESSSYLSHNHYFSECNATTFVINALFKFDTFHTPIYPQILSMYFVLWERERGKKSINLASQKFFLFYIFRESSKKKILEFFSIDCKTFFFREWIFAPFVCFWLKNYANSEKTKNKLFLFNVRRSNGLTYLITQHFFLSCLPLRRFSSIKFFSSRSLFNWLFNKQ